MQIQSQIQAADPTQLAGATSTAAPPPAAPSIDGLANENTFLQLLVAQIKNQDPTNPTDSVQFHSQLAQFSQLEQLIGIRQELQPAATTSASGGSSTGTPNPSGGTSGTAGTTN
jgi:flagellar basal-body rod modification protein FlgD